MYTNEKNVNRLFGIDVQYQAPLYQRRYVWNETNWEILWNDIHSQVDLKLTGGNGKHFMGAIVTRPVESGQLHRFEVIDGQQRLATFQIILCVIRDICQAEGWTEITRIIDQHISNSLIKVERDTPEARYKFLPTLTDKEAFFTIIDGNPIKNINHLILQAYNYFKTQITAYTTGNFEKIKELLFSVIHDFVVIEIRLDSSDRAEKIFESINARGGRLSEFDLLRNNIFLRAGTDRERLYHAYWGHFDEEAFWTTEILEQFLQGFLTAKLETKIETDNLFNVYEEKYRSTLEPDQGVEHELAELKQYAEVYREKIEHDA